MFEVLVDPAGGEGEGVKVSWREVKLNVEEAPTSWSEDGALTFK